MPFQPRRISHRRTPPATAAAPAVVTVLDVQAAPGEPTKALWQFSQAVIDPPDGISDFVIDGQNPFDFLRQSDDLLLIEYPGPVDPGMPWSNPAAAGGMTGTDGQPLAAGSGTVVA